MVSVYYGNIHTGGLLKYITHGSDGVTVTAKSSTNEDFHLSKKVNL
jgi:hypothetical protein